MLPPKICYYILYIRVYTLNTRLIIYYSQLKNRILLVDYKNTALHIYVLLNKTIDNTKVLHFLINDLFPCSIITRSQSLFHVPSHKTSYGHNHPIHRMLRLLNDA